MANILKYRLPTNFFEYAHCHFMEKLSEGDHLNLFKQNRKLSVISQEQEPVVTHLSMFAKTAKRIEPMSQKISDTMKKTH